MYYRIKLLCGFSAVCAVSMLASATRADEYTYIGPNTGYSFDDPASWDPSAPTTLGAGNDWAAGNTLKFNSLVNSNTAIVLKNYGELEVENLIFTTTGNVWNGFGVNTNQLETGIDPSIKVTGKTIVNGVYDAEGSAVDGGADFNNFQYINFGNVEIGNNSSKNGDQLIFLRQTISLTNQTQYYYNSKSDNNVTFDAASVALNGTVPTGPNDLKNTTWFLNRSGNNDTQTRNIVLRVGGISGMGLIRNSSGDYVADTTTLVFANQTDSSFKGIIADDWVSDTKTCSISIIMDGTENATQTIRHTGVFYNEGWSRDNLDSIGTTIKNGTLALSGASTMEFARVKIEGGALAVAESDGTGYGGHLWVRGIDWVDGKIKVSVNNASLRSTNGINQLGGDSAKYVFEVDLSGFASDFVFEGDEYTVLQSDGKLFGDISKYEAEFTYNGTKIDGLTCEFFEYDYGLNVSIFGTIPEPSAVAAVLGALALAAAAVRKIKSARGE